MKKKKNWTRFEIAFLVVSLATIVVCFIFSQQHNYFSLASSLIGVVAVLTVSKGLFWAPFINVVYNTFYAIISYTQGFYGEFIISIVLMNAIYIMSIIDWLKNRSKENSQVVKINKISGKEYMLLGVGIAVMTIVFYFILQALNTKELIVGTISLVGSVAASYLMLRRSSFYAIGYIFNDIVLIIMWSLNVASNGLGYLPTVICFVTFLFNDTYGLIHWKMEEKKQAKNNLEQNNQI